MERKCVKCGYPSEKNKSVFGVFLCEFCKFFAPFEKENFLGYISKKVKWEDLESFRNQKRIGSSKQKEGMVKKAKKGGAVSRAPFGYKIVEKKLVKAENFRVVENIFLDFQNSEVSLNKLSKKYGFSLNGIKKILRNFAYIGKIKFDGEIYEGTHDPIISSTLFNHVQDKLERLGIREN